MRFLSILILLSISIALLACANPTPPPSSPTAPPAAPTEQPTPAGVVTATAEPLPTATASGGELPTAIAPNAPTETPPAQTPIPEAPVGTDSPLIGLFANILPATDVPGRIVTLDLAVDGSATMTTQLIGKGEPIVENGTWHEEDELAYVVFTLRDGAPQDNRITWKFEDNTLTSVAYDETQYGPEGLTLKRIGTGITQEASYEGVSFTFDTALAQSAQGSTQPAVPADPNAPALGGGAPQNIRFLFDNAQVESFFNPRLPQVYVYPVAGLKVLDPSVAKNVETLEKILADKQVAPDQDIPIFPVMPASQVLHAQTRFLDFVNGTGVSFVTAYKQDASALTSDQIFYTFQGITLDGLWYVAAYWNVSTPALPADGPAAQNVLPPDVTAQQYEAYLAQTVATLDKLPSAGFAPNLRLLDQMVQSIHAEPELETPQTPAPNATVISPPNETPAPNATAANPPTSETPAPNTTPASGQNLSAEYSGASIAFASALAQSAQGATIPAVPVDTNMPALGGGAPEHIAFSFNGETVTTDANPFQPAVRIYPTDALNALDPIVAQQVEQLKTLLASKPATSTQTLPVFPVFNAAQVIHPQVKYLNFKNGQGVRFVTFYAQDVSPITNDGLFYTFQGLSNDGKHYVTIYWPLRTDQLPNSYQDANIQDYDAFVKQAEQYLDEATTKLNALPPEAFTPNLTALDQLAESIQTPQ